MTFPAKPMLRDPGKLELNAGRSAGRETRRPVAGAAATGNQFQPVFAGLVSGFFCPTLSYRVAVSFFVQANRRAQPDYSSTKRERFSARSKTRGKKATYAATTKAGRHAPKGGGWAKGKMLSHPLYVIVRAHSDCGSPGTILLLQN